MQPGKRLLDKVASVTGGASGIGAETARGFAMHGATVVLCDVQDEMGRAVAQEITDAGGAAEERSLQAHEPRPTVERHRSSHGIVGIVAEAF